MRLGGIIAFLTLGRVNHHAGPATTTLLLLRLLAIAAAAITVGCVFFHGQRYRDFAAETPLASENVLILGFLGGRDSWSDPRPGVARLAKRLRETNEAGVAVEIAENRKRPLALQLIHNSFDRDQDGIMDAEERAAVRLVLYGQSFGGAAVIKLARELHQREIPVLLTVQVDSVGLNDALVPPNVACAANLFQRDGILIQGEPEVRAEEPTRTHIFGNFKYDYDDKTIELSAVPWYKKIFRVAHTKMDRDPEVWAKVEELIWSAVRTGCSPLAVHRPGTQRAPNALWSTPARIGAFLESTIRRRS